VRLNKPLFQRGKDPPAQIVQSAPQGYPTPGWAPAGRKLGCKSLGGWEQSRSVRPGGKQSTRPYAKANRLSLEMQTHPDLQQQEASADGGRGSAEPVYGWRRLSPTGKNWTEAPAGLPGYGLRLPTAMCATSRRKKESRRVLRGGGGGNTVSLPGSVIS
jgi:hypothetical protein